MIRIPLQYRDLRRYVRKRLARRVLGFCAWIAIWIGGALAYNQNHQTYPPERLMLGWRLWLWIAVAVISGVAVFGVHRLLLDRPFRGTVIQCGSSHTYSASSDPGTTSRVDYDFRLNKTLKVRLPNGKLRRLRFEQKNGFYQYYREGSELVRLYGLPYPINTDPEGKNGYVCAACGAWAKELPACCPACEHSVIDPRDLQ